MCCGGGGGGGGGKGPVAGHVKSKYKLPCCCRACEKQVQIGMQQRKGVRPGNEISVLAKELGLYGAFLWQAIFLSLLNIPALGMGLKLLVPSLPAAAGEGPLHKTRVWGTWF